VARSFVVDECAIGSRFADEVPGVMRSVVQCCAVLCTATSLPLTLQTAKAVAKADRRGIEAEYWRQDHNARNDNHAVQLHQLQCALPLNQSRGWAGNG
jgi:hypothetical protein